MSERRRATPEQIEWFEKIGWRYFKFNYACDHFTRRGHYGAPSIEGRDVGWQIQPRMREAIPLKFECPIEAYQWAVLEGLVDD